MKKLLFVTLAIFAFSAVPQAAEAKEVNYYSPNNQFYCPVSGYVYGPRSYTQLQELIAGNIVDSYKIRYTDGTSSNCIAARKPKKAAWTAAAEFMNCLPNSTSGYFILNFEADGVESGVYPKYQLQGSVVPGSWYTIAYTNKDWHITSVGQSPSTHFRVRGWNGQGWGDWSDTLVTACSECQTGGGGQPL